MGKREGAEEIMWTAEDRERNMHLAMDTALHCFRELGVEHSTQKIISQRSGLSSKSLQRYFGSKEELVLKSMGLYADQYCERLNGYLRTQPPAKNGLEQILQLGIRSFLNPVTFLWDCSWKCSCIFTTTAWESPR